MDSKEKEISQDYSKLISSIQKKFKSLSFIKKAEESIDIVEQLRRLINFKAKEIEKLSALKKITSEDIVIVEKRISNYKLEVNKKIKELKKQNSKKLKEIRSIKKQNELVCKEIKDIKTVKFIEKIPLFWRLAKSDSDAEKKKKISKLNEKIAINSNKLKNIRKIREGNKNKIKSFYESLDSSTQDYLLCKKLKKRENKIYSRIKTEEKNLKIIKQKHLESNMKAIRSRKLVNFWEKYQFSLNKLLYFFDKLKNYEDLLKPDMATKKFEYPPSLRVFNNASNMFEHLNILKKLTEESKDLINKNKYPSDIKKLEYILKTIDFMVKVVKSDANNGVLEKIYGDLSISKLNANINRINKVNSNNRLQKSSKFLCLISKVEALEKGLRKPTTNYDDCVIIFKDLQSFYKSNKTYFDKYEKELLNLELKANAKEYGRGAAFLMRLKIFFSRCLCFTANNEAENDFKEVKVKLINKNTAGL